MSARAPRWLWALVLTIGLLGVVGPARAEPVGVPVSSDRAGTVTAWGENSSGQSTIPASLAGKTVAAIAAGGHFSLALTSDGKVTAWGDNLTGQLAVPPGLSDVTAIAAGTYHALALTSAGTIVAWGDNSSGQRNVPANPPGITYTAIAAGHGDSLALRSDGTVVGWGDNTAGQTTVPATPAGITYTAIAAGVYHSLALRSDGTVVGWGDTTAGQTTVPATPAGITYTAVAAGTYHSLALRSDGTVVGWGSDGDGQSTVPASLTGKTVTAIAASFSHSIALCDDGTVAAWGADDSAQSTVPGSLTGKTVTAIAAGAYHSLAITAALTADADPIISGVARVGGALRVVAGRYSAEPDRFDYQWYAGGSPVGTSSPVYRPSAADLDATITVAVTAHTGIADATTVSAPTLPVVGGGTITSWGDNSDGQRVVPASLTGRTVDALVAADYHSLALTAGGLVTAWGWDNQGQSTVPPGLATKNVIAIAAGQLHSMALADDGSVTAWGDADPLPAPPAGQTIVDIAGGGASSYALTDDGTLLSSGPTTVPNSLTGKTVVAISAGQAHALALTSDGTVTAWGNNTSGQASVPASLTGKTVVAVSAGYSHSLALTSEGAVIAWGSNSGGQGVVPPSLTGRWVVAIDAGETNNVALLDDGSVVAWGRNNVGQSSVPASLTGRSVTEVSVGAFHGMALTPRLSATQDPTISGTTRVGEVLTASPGNPTPTPDQLSYTWYADGTPIPGAADAPTYLLGAGQVGAQITVGVTATKARYDALTQTSAPVGPVSRASFAPPPTATLTGTARTGQTLTATAGSPLPVPDQLSYTWYADGNPIPGATDAPTYALSAAEVGALITVEVTAVRAGYVTASDTSDPLGPVAGSAAPAVDLRVGSSHLRQGRSTRLAWTSTGATSLTAGGGWDGPRAGSGSVRVRPSTLGTTAYTLTARNAAGATVSRVAVWVARQAVDLTVRAGGGPRLPGTRVTITTRGLAPRERYTVRLRGRVIATGTAPTGGPARKTVRLPGTRHDDRYRFVVTGSAPDRRGAADVAVMASRKTIPLRLTPRRVRASDPATLVTTALAPGEPVTVVYEGRRVSPVGAHADRHGRYRLRFDADIWWGTKPVRLTGATSSRSGTASLLVYHRCIPATVHVCA